MPKSELARFGFNSAQISGALANAAHNHGIDDETLVGNITAPQSIWPDTFAQLMAGKMLALPVRAPEAPPNAFPALVDASTDIRTLASGTDKKVAVLPPGHHLAPILGEKIMAFGDRIPDCFISPRWFWYRLVGILSDEPMTMMQARELAAQKSGCIHTCLRELIYCEAMLSGIATNNLVVAAFVTPNLPVTETWRGRCMPFFFGKHARIDIVRGSDQYAPGWLFLMRTLAGRDDAETAYRVGPVWLLRA